MLTAFDDPGVKVSPGPFRCSTQGCHFRDTKAAADHQHRRAASLGTWATACSPYHYSREEGLQDACENAMSYYINFMTLAAFV
jgi:hypothetical protein